jgi:NitT/TauT family transport system permease protein
MMALLIATSESRRERIFALALPTITGIGVLVLWQFATMSADIPEIFLPSPAAVLLELNRSAEELWFHGAITATETTAAFVLAILVGGGLAVLISFSVLFRETVFPTILTLQMIPKIALAPLFIIWFGIDLSSRIAFGVFVSFFPIIVQLVSGLAGANENAIRLCRSLDADRWQIFLHVKLPYALPYFFAGLKISSTLSVIGVVVGEFISANAGLGYYILSAGAHAETAKVFAGVVALCVLGIGLYLAVLLAECMARKWWHG